MNEIQSVGQDKLYQELREIDDAYTAETRYFLDFCEANGYDLIEGYKPYAESLDKGYIDRNGERRSYSAAAFNKRIAGARNRIKYAFRRSPEFSDVGKRLQLDEFLGEAKTIKKATNQVADEKVLTADELRALCTQTRSNRLRLIIQFLASTGLRISEALSIRLADTKRNGASWKINVIGKGKKERVVHADIALVELIRETFAGETYLFEHSGKQYNRISITNMIRSAAIEIIGRPATAHMLRHSWATIQLDQGRSLKAVSEYLGHSSTAITADIYQHDHLEASDAILSFNVPTETVEIRETKPALTLDTIVEPDPEDEQKATEKLGRIHPAPDEIVNAMRRKSK